MDNTEELIQRRDQLTKELREMSANEAGYVEKWDERAGYIRELHERGIVSEI